MTATVNVIGESARGSTREGIPPSDAGRRAFLRDALRLGVLAVLGRLAAALWRRRANSPGESCTGGGVCTPCSRREACGLPAALSRRRRLSPLDQSRRDKHQERKESVSSRHWPSKQDEADYA